MERGQTTSVNRSETTVAHDPEKTAVVPRFDQSEVGRARPAVPLDKLGSHQQHGRRRPRPLLIAAAAAGLAGGVLGGVGTAVYQRYNSAQRASAAQTETARDDPARTSAGEASAQAGETVTTPAVTSEPAATIPAAADVPGEAEANADANADANASAPGGAQAELSAALAEWVAATNARDVERQMSLYDSRLDAFYLARDASRESVRAEKRRVFSRASTVDVRASGQAVTVSPDGRTAVMRFRKRYQIEGDGVGRSGEVLQELRWRRTPRGWRIVSERDLRVID